MEYKINKELPYRDAVAALEEAVNNMDLYNRQDLLTRFALFSANLQCFMPQMALDEHDGWFRYFCLQQHLAHLDQNHPQALKALNIQGLDALWEGPLAPGPGIICTYHTGSYRLINKLLMQKEIPFALLVAGDVLRDEERLYRQIFQELCPQAPLENFRLIDAQSPGALLQMLRVLSRGVKLLVYVDGNSGIGETATARNGCEVNFFDRKLCVRKGVGVLSYMADFPLFPVLCKRVDKTTIAFDMHKAILPDKNLSRAVFVQQTMELLYGYLQQALQKNPADWEGWCYAHHYLIGKNNGHVRLPKRVCEAIQQHKWVV